MKRMIPLLSRAAALFALAGLAALESAGAAAEPAELAQRFFASPRLSRLQISPSGEHLAALYTENGQEMIVVRSIDGSGALPIASLPDPEARFRWLRWANDERILFSVEEPMPSRSPPRPRRSRLYAINRDGSKHVHMARNWNKSILMGRGDFQFEDQIIDMLEDDPRHVLISIRKPTEAYPAAYLLDVQTGGVKPQVPLVEGVLSWHADHDGVVRVGTGYQYKQARFFARASAQDEFRELAAYDVLGDEGFYFEGFSHDPDVLYVSKLKDGFTALYEYKLSTGEVGRELYSNPGFDVPAWLEFHEEHHTLTAAGHYAEGRERHFFDDRAQARQAAIDRALPWAFNEVVSESRDRSVALVRARGPKTPASYYLYRPAEKNLSFLASTAPGVVGLQLGEMKPVSYEARDGMEIPAFLTLPNGVEPKGLPAIILPHGGPSARDVLDWDAQTQYLAALGFAVLQPNFRGSTGYGSAHQSAGLQEWGLAMQDDVSDGVSWLVDNGIADPHRICIFGSSYGGYTALMGLIKTPELYRCGASYAGPSDLVMLLNHDKGYLFSEVNVPLLGSTTRDRERLKSNSPIENTERFQDPVFLAHGEDDQRVHVAHSEKLAKQLDKAGKEVTYLHLEHEAHSFRDEANRVGFFAELGRFLLQHTQPNPSAAPTD